MRVNTQELERQSASLNVQTHRLYELQDSVLRIARDLSAQSVTEPFNMQLRAAANAIEQSCRDLGQLRMALLQIASLYERSENCILDEAEAAVVRNEHSPYVITALPGINEWNLPPLFSTDAFLSQLLSDDVQE